MTTRLADGAVAAVGGSIRKHQPRTWAQRHAITVVDGQQQLSYLPALHLPYVAGANAGFVTSKLREAGGFDEELQSGNDVDVCYKLGLRGHQVGLAPDAVIQHDDRATVAAHFRRFHRYAVYQVLLYAKYKHISAKRYVVDTYPLRRAAQAGVAAALRGAPAARRPWTGLSRVAATHRGRRRALRRHPRRNPIPAALPVARTRHPRTEIR